MSLLLCILPPPARNASRTVAYPGYICEVLAHAGFAYREVAFDELSGALAHRGVFLTVGEYKLAPDLHAALASWVREGGCWISIGGTCGVPELFGVMAEPPAISSWGGGAANLGEGYLVSSDGAAHQITDGAPIPLHYFNGIPVRAAGARVLAHCLDAHQRETDRAGITEHSVGAGRAILIAPDINGTVVRIQQGIGVTRDGVPAADGTGPICDDVLKSGDGGALDWIFDRQEVEGVPGFKAFTHPIADLWRDLLLRTICYAAVAANAPLHILWYWPRNLPAVAHLSLDTDSNEPEKAERMLSLLKANHTRASWCVILPGYERELLRRIRADGHELAMHYDAMTDGLDWGQAQFDRQFKELTTLFEGAAARTNKNHYLRWEGDCELFDWCAAREITFDQSKGASKTGEAGFNFGTCHPYFPARFNGELIDVLELPTPTQDLAMFAPPELLAPLERAALGVHGVMHLLFHPYHIVKPEVAASLELAIKSAKAAGMEWWTAAEIDRWERARRSVKWEWKPDGIAISIGADLTDATLLELCGKGSDVELWGANFRARTITVGANETVSG